MDMIQCEKVRIQKREETARGVLFFLLLAAFLLPASLLIFLAHSPNTFIQALFATCLLPLSFGFLFFFIFGLGMSQVGPYMQKTQQQKQRWLDEHGMYVLATVSRQPGENALLIGGSDRGRSASYVVYMNCQDPLTGQLYSFRVNTRFSSVLRKLQEGDVYPVQFDSADPTLCVVPESGPAPPAEAEDR
jgi:uncharacterized integral membrane protein